MVVIKNIILGFFYNLFDMKNELYRSRRKVCNKCESNKKIMGMHYCDQCGCFLRAKLRVKDEKCLMNKW